MQAARAAILGGQHLQQLHYPLLGLPAHCQRLAIVSEAAEVAERGSSYIYMVFLSMTTLAKCIQSEAQVISFS